MKSRVAIDDLRVGMYVSRIDRSWIKTPFFRHSFRIKDEKQIRKLRDAGVDSIIIDTDKGPPPETAPSGAAPPESPPPGPDMEPRYIALSPEALDADETLGFALYCEADGKKRLFLDQGLEFGPEARGVLAARGIDRLYVSGLDEEALAAYIEGKRRGDDAEPFTPEEFHRYSREKEAHYSVDRDLLKPGAQVGFRLYLKRGFRIEPLHADEDEPPFRLGPALLGAEGEFVIRAGDVQAYREYITGALREPGRGSGVRSRVARETAKISVKDLFDNPRSGQNIRNTRETVTEMIDIIFDKRGAFTELLTLNSYDLYSYTHSVNVAVLSISLGKCLGLSGAGLFELGLGCILHDIGKAQTPHEILNKPGRLTSEELKVMQRHVVLGHEMLKHHDDIPGRSMKTVLEHHETLSGRGYPFGLKGTEIELFGKISSLIDIYDALTTDRPYKKAFSAFYALSVIGERSEDYDPDIYDEFVRMLGKKA